MTDGLMALFAASGVFGDMLLVHQYFIFPFSEQFWRWVVMTFAAIFHSNPRAAHDHFEVTAVA